MARTRRDMQRHQPTTAERGYGPEHVRLRAMWKPKVDAGEVMCHAIVCLKPDRWIVPGTPWDLGHTPDRSAWTGPEHRTCNRADGGIRGNRSPRRRRHSTRWMTSRQW